MTALKVSGNTNPTSLAGAIAGTIREEQRAEIMTVGAAALNQTIKAIAIARGYVAPTGIDLICIPGFKDIIIDGQERTALRLVVEPR